MHNKKYVGMVIVLTFFLGSVFSTQAGGPVTRKRKREEQQKNVAWQKRDKVFSFLTLQEVSVKKACQLPDDTWISHEDLKGALASLKGVRKKINKNEAFIKHPLTGRLWKLSECSNRPSGLPKVSSSWEKFYSDSEDSSSVDSQATIPYNSPSHIDGSCFLDLRNRSIYRG